jgi:hypothetical protein
MVVAANSGRWWRSASDGSRKVNVEQKQKKMEMVADRQTVTDGGAMAAVDGGGGQRQQWHQTMGGGLLILNNIVI